VLAFSERVRGDQRGRRPALTLNAENNRTLDGCFASVAKAFHSRRDVSLLRRRQVERPARFAPGLLARGYPARAALGPALRRERRSVTTLAAAPLVSEVSFAEPAASYHGSGRLNVRIATKAFRCRTWKCCWAGSGCHLAGYDPRLPPG
jgi:hypothetical protein